MADSADEVDMTSVAPFRLTNTAEAQTLWNYCYEPGVAMKNASGGYEECDWWATFNSVLGWNDDYEAPCTLVILVINELDVPLSKDDWAETGGYAWYEPTGGTIPAMVAGMPGLGVFGVDEGSSYGPIGAIHFAPSSGLPNGLTIGYRTYQLKSEVGCASFVKLQTDTASGVASWFWENAAMDGSNEGWTDQIAATDSNGNPITVIAESIVTGSQSPGTIPQAAGTSEYFIYTMVVRIRPA